jgi:hypothetical protein
MLAKVLREQARPKVVPTTGGRTDDDLDRFVPVKWGLGECGGKGQRLPELQGERK